jgi:uncharacterized protein
MLEKPQEIERNLWILTGGRVGDLKQMQVLANDLGWGMEIKELAFSTKALSAISSLAPRYLTAASRAALDQALPDLVLAAESRTAAVALSLKEKSGGRVKVVCIGRPRGRLPDFDLIITTTQYELPAAANTMEISLPLTEPTPAVSSLHFDHLRRPHVFFMIGGTSAPFILDDKVASLLARDAVSYAEQGGGTLFVSTSPRTGVAVDDIINGVTGTGETYLFWSRKSANNPYRDFLATADECVVTADSVSMMADAINAGKPTAIYRLPEHWSWRQRVVQKLWRNARSNPASLVASLFDLGLIESRANRTALNENLVRDGLAAHFRSPLAAPKMRITEVSRISSRIKDLFKT